jgi:nitrate/nitrite-specific signal transduction histidine kinase
MAIHTGDPAAQEDTLINAGDRLSRFDAGVLVLDTFGRVVASQPEWPGVMGEDRSGRFYYREIVRDQIQGQEDPLFSNVVPEGRHAEDVVMIAVPITGDHGEFFGIVMGMVSAGEDSESIFFRDLVGTAVREKGATYLLDGNGRLIYHSTPDLFAELHVQRFFNEHVQTEGAGADRGLDIEGNDIVASFAPVPGTAWSLVVEEQWANLIQRGRRYQVFLLSLLMIGIVTPILIVGFGVRRVMQPIEALIKAAQAVAKGNFGQTIKAQTGDEIEELAHQFNRMSAQLEQSQRTLEERVADRTKELETLNAIAAVVSRSLDLDEILQGALDKTLEVLKCEGGGIYLLQEEDQILKIAAHRGMRGKFVAEVDDLKAGESFPGHLLQSGEPLVVEDITQDSRLSRLITKEEDFHSIASIPLPSRDRVLGTLFVITRTHREFTQQEVELLVSIGRQVGGAVANARLYEQVQKSLRELESLYRADAELYSHLSLDQVLQVLVEIAMDILQAEKGSLIVWDEEQEKFVVKASIGFHPETVDEMVFDPGEGIVGIVGTTGKSVVVGDSDETSHVARRITDPETIRSFMHVPIEIGGHIYGVFNVNSSETHAFGIEEQQIFESLAKRAAQAIQNAQLYEQAQQIAAMEERQRLARDLHDAVTQTLFSASLIAEVLPRLWTRDQEEGLRRLNELRQLTRGALAEMRTLLVELRPAAILEAELEDLIGQLAEATTGRAGLPISLEIAGGYTLPDDVKVGMYRIAQEAMNNVAKHAQASEARVRLKSKSGGAVELVVVDDGRGFDPDMISPENLGLGIMQERADALGLELKIDSSRGQGTQVCVVWEPTKQDGETS